MIFDSCLIPDGLGANYVWGDKSGTTCCAQIICRLYLSPGEPVREVTHIENDPSNDCDFTILEVDGQPWDNPLTNSIVLTATNSITLRMLLCPCQPLNTPWYAGITVKYQGGQEDFRWEFETVDIDESPWNPLTITDLEFNPCINNLQFCDDQQGFFYYNNPTALYYPVTLNVSCGSAIGLVTWYLNDVQQIGNVLSIPPFTTAKIGFGFCVGFTTPEVCSIEVLTCDFDPDQITLTITPTNCGPCGIGCIDYGIITEGNYLSPVTALCPSIPLAYYDKAAIGEKKFLYFTYSYSNGFQNGPVNIYFNPGLFATNCGLFNLNLEYNGGQIDHAPEFGWTLITDPANINLGPIPMGLYGTNPGALNTFKNWVVTASITQTTVTINFEFYMVAQYGFINNSVFPNQFKLTRALYTQAEFDNSAISVYNGPAFFNTLFYLEDPNVPITIDLPFPLPDLTRPYFCHVLKCVQFAARFWNKGLQDILPSEFTNPDWQLSRTSGVVTNFSAFEKTKIRFRITNTFVTPITKIIFWVFDKSKTDDTVDFLTNYDSSRSAITTLGGVSVINNHLQSPSTFTGIGGNVYEATAYIDTNLDPAGEWCIGAIVYNEGAEMVNSFISCGYLVNQYPDDVCCTLEIAPEWLDYYNIEDELCFSPVPKERVKNRLTIENGSIGACFASWGLGKPWYKYLTSINLKIYREVNNFPNSGEKTYFLFDEHQSNYISGFPGNFDNLDNEFTCVESGGVITTEWTGRVRYESNLIPNAGQVFTANSSTPLNWVPAGFAGAGYVTTNGITYNWADQDIYFQYVLKFDLTAFFPVPFVVNYAYRSHLHPMDFELNPSPWSNWFLPLEVYGWKNGNQTLLGGLPICRDSYDYFEIVIKDSVGLNDGFIIATLDPFQYNSNSLIESDGFGALSGNLPQLNNPIVYDVPIVYTFGCSFKIDAASLPAGKYQICAIYIDER